MLLSYILSEFISAWINLFSQSPKAEIQNSDNIVTFLLGVDDLNIITSFGGLMGTIKLHSFEELVFS